MPTSPDVTPFRPFVNMVRHILDSILVLPMSSPESPLVLPVKSSKYRDRVATKYQKKQHSGAQITNNSYFPWPASRSACPPECHCVIVFWLCRCQHLWHLRKKRRSYGIVPPLFAQPWMYGCVTGISVLRTCIRIFCKGYLDTIQWRIKSKTKNESQNLH